MYENICLYFSSFIVFLIILMVGGHVRSQLLFMAKDINEPSPDFPFWLGFVSLITSEVSIFPAVLSKNPDLIANLKQAYRGPTPCGHSFCFSAKIFSTLQLGQMPRLVNFIATRIHSGLGHYFLTQVVLIPLIFFVYERAHLCLVWMKYFTVKIRVLHCNTIKDLVDQGWKKCSFSLLKDL